MLLRTSPSGKYIDIPLAGNLSVATIAALGALPDDTDTPDWVWVEALLCYWHRNRTSTLFPDGITNVAAVGGGRWQRVVETTAPDWLTRTTWELDPALGNDENPGTTALPLRTIAELNRRLSVGPLVTPTTLYIVEGATVPTGRLEVDRGGYVFTVQGRATTLFAGTLDLYVDRVHNAFPVAPTPPIVTDVGIGDFTPYEGTRMRITSGLAVGAVCWLDLANPAGGGVTTCRCTRFSSAPASGSSLPNAVSPAATSAYVIEELPSIEGLTLVDRATPGTATVLQIVSFIVRDLYIGSSPLLGGQLTILAEAPWYCMVDGCRIDGPVITSTSNVYARKAITRSKFGGPSGSTDVLFFGGVLASFCLALQRRTVLATSDTMAAQHCLWHADGTGILTASDENLTAAWELQDCQIWNAAIQAISLTGPGMMRVKDGLSGTGNGRGLVIGGVGTDASGGQSFYWCQAPDLPNLSGVAGTVRVTGLANIDTDWTELGAVDFRSDGQSGASAVAAGTVVVTARNANLRAPKVTKLVPGGAPQGVLAVVAVAAANFTVEARDLATGALVATDTSTFGWEIPPFARDIVIAQGNRNT